MINRLCNLFNELHVALRSLNYSSTFTDYFSVVLKELHLSLVVLCVACVLLFAIAILPAFIFVVWRTTLINAAWVKHVVAIRDVYDPVEETYNYNRSVALSTMTSHTEKNNAILNMVDILKEHDIEYQHFDIEETPLDEILKGMPIFPVWRYEDDRIKLLGDFKVLDDSGRYKSFKTMHASDVALRVFITVLFLVLYTSQMIPLLFILF